MKKLALGLPLVLMAPLLLLFLGMGNANIAAVQAACGTATTPSTGGMFGIGTLNWRGASHYETNPHLGERPYTVRVPNMVAKVGASGASIIGFQEFESPQAQAFLKATHGAWAIVKGRDHGNPSTANSIAYQPGVWTVAEVRYVGINYGGPTIQIPLVRFTSTKGLGSIWVLNTHNPADAVNGSDAIRDDAVRAEATVLRRLQASEPNTPLFFTGDMNDTARFKNLFLTSVGGGWSSANPGENQIDWIMGSSAVTFSGTVVDQSTNDNAHDYTDHPFVYTSAQLTAATSQGAAGTGQSGTGTDLGVMPASIDATPGGPVNGSVLIANANIKLRSGFTPGVRALTAPSPDFITLNEVGDVPIAQMQASAPGYGAYRDPTPVQSADGGPRSLDNAIMWRTDKWKMLDGGRVRIVQDDHVIFHGSNKNWGRWAIWGVFQRTDGAVVSVISSHQMTNPFRYPNSQWGDQPFTRATQYGQGMDYLVQLISKLSAYGPVFLGGDMNSHPGEGPESAAAKMQAAGYSYTKDSGVIFNFYAAPVSVEQTWEISKAAVHSDHPALFTRMAMNGAGPGGPTSSGATGTTGVQNIATGSTCPPCPTTYGDAGSVVLQNVAATDSSSGAQVAAKAAYQAGFRGDDLVTAVAIAHVESSWDPNASNGTHFGLWQIAASHKGLVPGWNKPGDIFDPLLNARYAFALYSGRPGAGAAKFADWLPFEHDDYHQYLDQARQAVAATVGTGALTPVANTAGSCAASPISVAGDLSAALSARINAMQHTPGGLCGLSWTHGAPCTYSGQCPKVVDALYGGPGVGRGYGNGQDVAQGIINAGLAQAHGTGLDPLPPVGAVVSYNRGDGVGHVAIYVGNGKIFGNDYGCSANGVYGCVGFADVHTPAGSVTWALPKPGFDLGSMPAAAA